MLPRIGVHVFMYECARALFVCVYEYVCVCVFCAGVAESKLGGELHLSALQVRVHVLYIYIYIYTHTHMYVCMYVCM
jgi:hypothetical protein